MTRIYFFHDKKVIGSVEYVNRRGHFLQIIRWRSKLSVMVKISHPSVIIGDKRFAYACNIAVLGHSGHVGLLCKYPNYNSWQTAQRCEPRCQLGRDH